MGPLLVSLVPRRFEDGGWSGVPRFDYELRAVFDPLHSRNTRLPSRLWLHWLARRHPEAIVITGNETSLLVPQPLRTVVVHHGCARTHFERDPHWRGHTSRRLVRAQEAMYRQPNRWFVATARWTALEFRRHHQVPLARVIPNWVPPIPRVERSQGRPVVLGDWRTFNKGSEQVAALGAALPNLELRPLRCSYQQRLAIYGAADCYLCLSLSEGGSYAMSDAEAAALPLVTTDVGNCLEYGESLVIPWQRRGETGLVAARIEEALATTRGPSFFREWTRERWTQAWHELVAMVADTPSRPPLLEE